MKNSKPIIKSKFAYFQIGIILVLLAVIFLIERKTEKIVKSDRKVEFTMPFSDEVMPEVVQKKSIPKKEPAKEIAKNTPQPFFEKGKEEDKEKATNKKEPADKDSKGKELSPDDIDDVIPDDPITYSPPVNINVVEEAPIFPGCEIYDTKDERADCLSSKISKMVQKKFDHQLAEKLGLTGQQKIYVTFTIDEKGKVTGIEARSMTPQLAEEAKRVAKLLPQMKPGKQQNKNVPVTYNLPIIFTVK